MNTDQLLRPKIAVDVPQPVAAKPIPTEIADINRSLGQLHDEIDALRSQLNGVLESPSPATSDDGKTPQQSGMLGDIFSIHRGIRAAISIVQSTRERLML